jgi:hypothetical protein
MAGLLRERCLRANFGCALDIAPHPWEDFENPGGDGIAVCLPRIALNISRRNLGPYTDIAGWRFRPLLSLDLLLYLKKQIAKRSRAPAAYARLSNARARGRRSVVCEQAGRLPPRDGHFCTRREPYPVLAPLPLSDYLTLWDEKLPPTATYVLRMLLIDPETALDEGLLVRERNLGMGVASPRDIPDLLSLNRFKTVHRPRARWHKMAWEPLSLGTIHVALVFLAASTTWAAQTPTADHLYELLPKHMGSPQ